MYGVTITELIKKMKMKNVLPEIDTDKVVLSHPDVNRPALQLTGFFDHFDREPKKIEINEIYSIDEDAKETLQEKIKRMLVTEAKRMAVYKIRWM